MRDEAWKAITSRNGWTISRKIVDGRGIWKAEKDGQEKPITYEQALGYEPIDNEEGLQMSLGRLLMPY